MKSEARNVSCVERLSFILELRRFDRCTFGSSIITVRLNPWDAVPPASDREICALFGSLEISPAE